jgi:GNAT superfamily N-acetyltransferase
MDVGLNGIRAVTEADHAAWLPLWQGYLTFYKSELPAAATESLWSRLLAPDVAVHGALAWRDGQAVGLAHWLMHKHTWSVADACYLNDLFVTPQTRGGGIGRALIEHVYGHATAAGCGRVYWLTHATNTTAQALYDRIAVKTGFIHYARSLG